MKTIAYTIGFLLLASLAWASRPVTVNIIGCVKHGALIPEQTDFGTHVSPGGHRIRVTAPDGDAVNLAPYEGRRIRVTGNLLPGDRFITNPEMIRVVGGCGARQPNRPMTPSRRY